MEQDTLLNYFIVVMHQGDSNGSGKKRYVLHLHLFVITSLLKRLMTVSKGMKTKVGRFATCCGM